MLDLFGAIGGVTVFAVMIGVLVRRSSAPGRAKVVAFVAAAIWSGVVITLAISGAFAPGTLGPLPAPVIAFAALVIVLALLWASSTQFRRALLAVPMPALIAVNAGRLAGIFFFALTAQGRMSGPFGPIAGLGDIIVGAFAIPLARTIAARRARTHTIALWNTIGAADLFIAILLGALSAPGSPTRVFTDGPGTAAMTEFPWVLVPSLLVPLYLLVHFTIAKKLRLHRRRSIAIQYAA